MQNLRSELMLIGEEKNTSQKKRFKVALNIHHFDEMKGVDDEILNLANRRLD